MELASFITNNWYYFPLVMVPLRLTIVYCCCKYWCKKNVKTEKTKLPDEVELLTRGDKMLDTSDV